MVPLSIGIYYFTMTATTFYPNFFLPAFADILVNIASVATFVNESVSSFEYFYLIKNCFSDLYVFPSKEITNRSIPAPAFYLFGLLSMLLKTSLSLYYGKISINSLNYCKNLAPSGNIPDYSSSLIEAPF